MQLLADLPPWKFRLAATGPAAEANLYRFSSKELHAASGLVYYLYRYYDPNLQRWPNRDPIEEASDQNLYRYTLNAPVDSIDPNGLYVITGTCDATQKRQIEASIKASCKKAKECASRCPSGTPTLAVAEICDNPNASTPVINCTKTRDGKPCTVCGFSPIGSGVINLCPKTFDRTQQDGFGCKRDCVIFHEANHGKKDVGLTHGTDMNNFDACMGCPRE